MKIWKWKDLIDAFIKQYKYNMNIAPDRLVCLLWKKGDKETIYEYAQWWRDWLSKYIPYSWIKRWLPCLLIPLKHPIMSM